MSQMVPDEWHLLVIPDSHAPKPGGPLEQKSSRPAPGNVARTLFGKKVTAKIKMNGLRKIIVGRNTAKQERMESSINKQTK